MKNKAQAHVIYLFAIFTIALWLPAVAEAGRLGLAASGSNGSILPVPMYTDPSSVLEIPDYLLNDEKNKATAIRTFQKQLQDLQNHQIREMEHKKWQKSRHLSRPFRITATPEKATPEKIDGSDEHGIEVSAKGDKKKLYSLQTVTEKGGAATEAWNKYLKTIGEYTSRQWRLINSGLAELLRTEPDTMQPELPESTLLDFVLMMHLKTGYPERKEGGLDEPLEYSTHLLNSAKRVLCGDNNSELVYFDKIPEQPPAHLLFLKITNDADCLCIFDFGPIKPIGNVEKNISPPIREDEIISFHGQLLPELDPKYSLMHTTPLYNLNTKNLNFYRCELISEAKPKLYSKEWTVDFRIQENHVQTSVQETTASGQSSDHTEVIPGACSHPEHNEEVSDVLEELSTMRIGDGKSEELRIQKRQHKGLYKEHQYLLKKYASLEDHHRSLFSDFQDLKLNYYWITVSERWYKAVASQACRQPVSYTGMLEWQIDNFQAEYDKAAQDEHMFLFSPPFYTSLKGYKLCLLLYPFGHQGSRGVKATALFVLMKGEYDDLLDWPFPLSVAVGLVKKSGDANLHYMTDEKIIYKKPTEAVQRYFGKRTYWLFGACFDRLIDGSLRIRCKVE